MILQAETFRFVPFVRVYADPYWLRQTRDASKKQALRHWTRGELLPAGDAFLIADIAESRYEAVLKLSHWDFRLMRRKA